MKLRSITLSNVRCFAGREAALGPFGDGLTTICAPNESGKSTFFDAIHALFFSSYTTTEKGVKSLQPYGGGPVRVAAEVEIDDALFRVEKSFLQRKTARVTEIGSGNVLGLEGEAEEWIKAHIQSRAGGPSGLLWVRQGTSSFGPQGNSQKDKNERERLRDVRRDLISSVVAGEIDAMTGGRRMDAIMTRAEAELDRLATSKMKPKGSGPWGAQRDEVLELEERRDEYVAKVEGLKDDLANKRRIANELAPLTDPEEEARRDREISEAREAVRIATEHAGRLETAARELQVMRLEADRVRTDLDGIRESRNRRASRERDIQRLERELQKAQADLERAEKEASEARAHLERGDLDRSTLARRVRDARRAEQRARDMDELKALKVLRRRVEDLEQQRREADKIVREAPLSEEDLEEIEALEARRVTAVLRREAGAASFCVHYEGAARARIGHEAIPDGDSRHVLERTQVTLDGLGTLTLTPAEDSGSDGDLEVVAAELSSRLNSVGAESLAGAREAVGVLKKARQDAAMAEAAILAIVPDGAEQLRIRIEELAPDEDAEPEGENGTEVAGAIEDAQALEAQLDRVEGNLQGLRSQSEETAEARQRASGEVREAATKLKLAVDERTRDVPPQDEAETWDRLTEDHAERGKRIEEAEAEIERMRQAAPDLALAEASLKRLEEAKRNAAENRAKLERSLHEINGRIQARADDSVEEQLRQVEEALDQARERFGRYELEAKALVALKDELEAARTGAQEIYFEPIKREIQPLLAALHPGASFEMDSEKMLVGKIVRNGVEDETDVLSGGASEQIAILTRLAFARLFQQEGRHVPVILDDALVHTDDDRISTMFTLLTQVAEGQQIIVFSCRNRAFADLGGDQATITTSETAE